MSRIILKFSKELFKKNSDKSTQRLIGSHLDSVDGKDVDFVGDVYGTCWYVHEGVEYMLYPVLKEWCDEEQLSLLEEEGQAWMKKRGLS